MRTTLKRGVGRSATANGNGHAVLPPAALTAVVRYKQPPPPRRSVWRVLARGAFWLVALLVMCASALAAGTWLYGEDTVSQIQARRIEVRKAAEKLNTPLPGKPAIALVIGYDKRHGEGADVPSRSDTLMLVRVDPERETISMLSFPRDLQAEIHCPGSGPYFDRINAAYATCQEKGAVETVKALTGLPINYLVTVNFRGFTQVVDKLGGIWVDVDRRYYNDNSGFGERYAAIDLQPGYQKLFGGDALSFVRFRHTDNDLVRNARQQLFLRAVKDRISHDLSADTIPKVVGALRRNIEVAVGGGKKLSLPTVISYALLAYQMPSGNVFRVKLDGNLLSGRGIEGDPLVASSEHIADVVQDFAHPDVDAPEKAAAAALGQKARLKRGLPPRQVSVVALNGNAVAGAAANATAQLAERGYNALLPPNGLDANAPTQDYFRTQVLYREGVPRSKQAAEQVANLFGAADIAPLPAPGEGAAARRITQLSNGAMLVAVVGTTFKGTLAQVPRDKTPERKPPNVVANPDLSRPYVREAQRRVLFPLQLPTVIERSSTIDSERPVRVYRVNGKAKAVRLTYRMGSNEYWGIQQTDWTEAPVFEGRNTLRRLNGREYELYFSGTHLHMVVLRDGDTSYWVVNTLLDSLSNETMLAIARGLKPLGNRGRAAGG
jgi:LCP family protein required for cell wall assembly